MKGGKKMNTSPTTDPALREAMYKAFGGKCFYTGQNIGFEDMAIDHILPKSKGGLDIISNYALTSRHLNSKKSAKVDYSQIERMLYLVKTVYTPKVNKYLHKQKKLKVSKNYQFAHWSLLKQDVVKSNREYQVGVDELVIKVLPLVKIAYHLMITYNNDDYKHIESFFTPYIYIQPKNCSTTNFSTAHRRCWCCGLIPGGWRAEESPNEHKGHIHISFCSNWARETESIYHRAKDKRIDISWSTISTILNNERR